MGMRAFILSLLVLCLVGRVQADITVRVDPSATWNGYMNVFEIPANGGGYLWGSTWGTVDLRATFGGDKNYLTLAPNTNCYNPDDAYWVNPDGSGNKLMEANFFQEWAGSGLAGQTVTFEYEVVENTLMSGHTAVAFIKVLDPGNGYAAVQSTTANLAVGANTLTLYVDPATANSITQVGFSMTGVDVDPAGAEAATGVVIGFIGGQPAMFPNPGIGEGLTPDQDTISWINPGPNFTGETVTADVFVLETDALLTYDPNLGPDVLDPGVVQVANDEPIESLDLSVAGYPIQSNKYYYWAVHVTDPNNGGPIEVQGYNWYFQTLDAAPTNVNAGVDQYVWLEAGTKQFTLTATYTDDGKSTVTEEWEDLSNPLEQAPGANVTINSPNSATTTVDVSGDGWFLFGFTVTDAVGSGYDEVHVGVYVSPCEAAKADPSDIQASYPDGHGDIDGDCDTDLADFALLAGSWVDCMSTKLDCAP